LSVRLDRYTSILGLLLFGVALWALHNLFAAHTYVELVADFNALSISQLAAAGGFTFCGYLTLTAYDLLGLRYLKKPVSRNPSDLHPARVILTSFLGFAFANNLGFLGGVGLRLRFYSLLGVTSLDVAKLVIFASTTFWMGFTILGGLLFLFQPPHPPIDSFITVAMIRAVGVLMLTLFGFYFGLGGAGEGEVRIGQWQFRMPSFRLRLAQVLVSSIDWTLAALVLYALLPPSISISFPRFLAAFLFAQILGLISHVPGGLGVFETVLVYLLPAEATGSSAVLASLLVFRIIYYVCPLLLATAATGIYEVALHRHLVRGPAKRFKQVAPLIVPPLFSASVFTAGMILLISGATPAEHERMAWIRHLLPLPIVELSHFLASVAGTGLVLLAFGLRRRLDAAWWASLVLLVSGAVFSLAKGFDFEESAALLLMALLLLPCRAYFDRHSSMIGERFSIGWIAAVLLAISSSIWLGFFSYKHVDYSNDLWWRFSFHSDAPRFLRASVGAAAVAIVFAISKLLAPRAPEPELPGKEELEKAARIVAESKSTTGHLALLGDKHLLFSKSGRSFVMYGIKGKTWAALEDPIGPRDEWSDLVWNFREMVDRHAGRAVFYEVDSENLHLYLDIGLTPFRLGETARVRLADFHLQGNEKKEMRNTRNKIEKDGGKFEIVYPPYTAEFISDLKKVSDAWLDHKHTREKGFSLGFFDPDYLSNFPIALVRVHDRIVGFANIWQSARKEELSVDLMRYTADAPKGVMDYLFIHLMLWGKEQGYEWFDLGMAPLSGLENRRLAPSWNRLGHLIYRHTETLYNFKGLRAYKAKFDPEWQPKYLMIDGIFSLPSVLTDMMTLISRGAKGVFSK
jgi:phosphatidylglycerol lysyltransferase